MPADFAPDLNYTASGIQHFRFWCQKTLPLVYDDSLSYYELLCKVTEFVVNSTEDMHKLDEAYIQLQDYVNHYFDSADFEVYVNDKLDEMAESGVLSTLITPLVRNATNTWMQNNGEEMVDDYLNSLNYDNLVTSQLNKMMRNGTMDNVVAPYASNATSAWLREHINPESDVVIDDSLTISGAAADARVTGFVKKNLSAFNCYNILSLYTDYEESHTYNGITYTRSLSSFTPYYTVSGTTSPSASDFSFYNIFHEATWPSGVNLSPGQELHASVVSSASPLYMQIIFYINGVLDSQHYNITTSNAEQIITIPANANGMLVRLIVDQNTALVNAHIACSILNTYPVDNIRKKFKEYNGHITTLPDEGYDRINVVLSDIKTPGCYVIGNDATVTDAQRIVPSDIVTMRYLIVEKLHPDIDDRFYIQRYGSVNTNKEYVSTCGSDGWTAFKEVGEGGGTTEINNYYNENTYNVTASPSISYNNNYFLTSTGDNTDRTLDIATMLNTYGTCNLGPGTFYTTGITLPWGSSIRGCGRNTELILSPGVTDGSCVTMTNYNTIENIGIIGATSDITVSSDIGTRNGILYEDYSSEHYKRRCAINNVFIDNFSGAGLLLRNVGNGPSSGVLVNNAFIIRCDVGIYIPLNSEYSNFNNINCTYCYYGCYDKCGNNCYSNCCFSRNTIGLVMDGTNSGNCGHGCFTNCTFNHSGNNPGQAIMLTNVKTGELFTGCHMHYGYLTINSCNGVSVCNCEFGNNTQINVNNSRGTMFNGCLVYSPQNLTIHLNSSATTKFRNCFTADGADFNP